MATKGSGGYGPSKPAKKAAPKKTTRPAPKVQPGPIRETEREVVTKFKKTPTYKRTIKRVKIERNKQQGKALVRQLRAEEKRDKPTFLQKKAAAVPEPIAKGLTKTGGVAMDILEETTRPLHAIAGSARAELRKRQGKVTDTDPVASFVKGARNKERYTYSDVLKEAGVKNKIVRHGVGFVADVAADPTTYVTLGTASVARQTALKTAKRVEKKALDKGLTAEQAKKMGDRAAKQAERTAPGGKKVTVGFGKRSVTTPLQAPKRKKGEGAVRDVEEAFRPAYRAPGTPEKAHKAVREAQAQRRAAVATGERKLTALARTFKKKLKPADYRQIIDAIESGSLKALPAHLHDPAIRLRSEFRYMDRLDRQAGIRAGTRKNYVPHVRRQDVEYGTVKEVSSGRPARGGSSAKRRKIDKRMAELRQAHDDLFTDDLPTILAKRGPETIRGVADVKLMRTLAEQGRKLTPDAKIDTATEAIYHVPAKSSVPRKLERDGKLDADEIQAAIDGKGRPGQYVILPKSLADDTIKSARRQELSGIRKRYRRLHGKVKTVLTMPMPSYHARNLYGDLWNASYKQDVGELGKNVGASAKVLRTRHKRRATEGSLTPGAAQKFDSGKTLQIGSERVPHERVIDEMEKHGVVGTGFSRELREMSGEAEKSNPLGKELRNIGEGRENLVRAATYIGARRQGLDEAAAAQRVRDLHFDYMDLTKSEESVRDFLPFYTWARKNTPLQAKTLATRPGKPARYQKVVEEGSKAAGIPVEDLKDHLKEYERIGVPIPLFGVRSGDMPIMVLPGLPITDLNRLTANPAEQVKQVASMVTLFKAAFEVAPGQGFSYFFRDEIDQGQKVAAPDWIGRLPLPPRIQEELGLENLYDKRYERKVWKWKPKWDYILKQFPESNFALQITTSAKNRRGQGTREKLLSLTGVRPQPIDKVGVDLDKAYSRRTSIENRLKALSKAGVNREAIDEKAVPAESKHLIPEYERLRKKVKAVNAEIYKLSKQKQDRGDAVSLPKAGAPPKKKAKSGNPLDSIDVGGNPLDKVGGGKNPLDAF